MSLENDYVHIIHEKQNLFYACLSVSVKCFDSMLAVYRLFLLSVIEKQ